jgi:hypothetical protein
LYGTHPPYWYIIAGLPAISGILFPFFVYEMIKTIWSKVGIIRDIIGSKEQRNNNLNDGNNNDKRRSMKHHNAMLWWCPKLTLITIIISYISFHSISSHKEFRFILPILPLVCILSSFPINRYVNIKSNDERKGLSTTTIKRKRKNILIILFFLFNYPHLFFLGMIHQRAPISVNQAIANHIHKLNELNYHSNNLELSQEGEQHQDQQSQKNMNRYSIHYLMGCHSAPLYSHLHVPTRSSNGSTSIRSATILNTWTLDCSPTCRKDSSCESDEFYANPYHFIMKSYYNYDKTYNDYHSDHLDECQVNTNDNDDHNDNNIEMNDSCQVHTMNDSHSHTNNMKKRSIPDFLAIFDNELSSVTSENGNHSINNVKDVIENQMGLFEIGKFRHSINGIQLKRTVHSRPTATSRTRRTTTHLLLPQMKWTNEGKLQLDILLGIATIEVSFDHIILYTTHKSLIETIIN